jgi:hypothetical protein
MFRQCCIKSSTRALARLLFTEILWMMLLAIDFTSMTWSRQKAGLLKKATLV